MDLFEWLLVKVIPIPSRIKKTVDLFFFRNILPYGSQQDDFVKVNKVNSNQVIESDMVIQIFDSLILGKIKIRNSRKIKKINRTYSRSK